MLSFLALGDLFTSAMTGNTALLAIAVGRGEFVAASRATCALLAFSLGVALATILAAGADGQPNARTALRRILLCELVVPGGCSAI